MLPNPDFPVDQIRQDLENRHPLLFLNEENGKFVVSGIYDLRHSGQFISKYQLRIELPADYPESIPQIYEVGNRIPRILDNHINNNGTLCLGVTEQIWMELQGKFELLPILDKHVRTFLLGVTNKLEGKGWPIQTRSHGAAGLCEFYGELIDSSCPVQVLQLIVLLLGKAPKGHWQCPCGSDRNLRNCHGKRILEFYKQKPPKELIFSSGAHITKMLEADYSQLQNRQNEFSSLIRQLSKFENDLRRYPKL